MRIVLDTNVLVSALLTPFGNPATILTLVLHGSLELQYDQRILSEYRAVLSRTKFGFSSDQVETLLEFIEQEGEIHLGLPSSEPFIDESDRKFWEIACASSAEALITGNTAHFPRHTIVMSPRDFLAFYSTQ